MDALVVIDVQQGMWAYPDYPPHDGEGVVARIGGLIEQARAAHRPVIFVQHEGEPGEALEPGAPGFELHPDLRPAAGEPVIRKRQCSAFLDTDLEAQLKGLGADHLVICGMQTEFCVDTAVRGAVDRGYRVTLVADGHSTGDNGVLKAADIVRHHNRTLRGFAAIKPAADIAFG